MMLPALVKVHQPNMKVSCHCLLSLQRHTICLFQGNRQHLTTELTYRLLHVSGSGLVCCGSTPACSWLYDSGSACELATLGAQVGWFLHTPFPSSEIYRALPVREELLRAVLKADLIGFHTYDYARHFVSACTRILGLEVCAFQSRPQCTVRLAMHCMA